MTSHDPAPATPVLPTGIQAVDVDGTVLGIVAQVWTDDATGQPSWVAVTDGLHASTTSLAPAAGARPAPGGAVQLAFPASAVLAAPRLAQHTHLDPKQEAILAAHYWPPAPTAGPAATGDITMDLSAEQLRVDIVRVPYARAVLRIETITEQVMVPVTITRQQARLELLDLPLVDPATQGLATAPAQTGTAWVTLFADEPVISTRPVAVERVRLQVHQVTEDQTVTAALGHEEIDVEHTTATDHRPPVPPQSGALPTGPT